jgi:hypothetical protein
MVAASIVLIVVALCVIACTAAFLRHSANKSRNDANHVVQMRLQAEAQERIAKSLEASCSMRSSAPKSSGSPSALPGSSVLPPDGYRSSENEGLARSVKCSQ